MPPRERALESWDEEFSGTHLIKADEQRLTVWISYEACPPWRIEELAVLGGLRSLISLETDALVAPSLERGRASRALTFGVAQEPHVLRRNTILGE
jgi:hypothetical protein